MIQIHEVFEYRDGQLYWLPREGLTVFNTRWAGLPAGSINEQGYVQVFFNGKNRKVHQLVWEMFNGPIPEGFEPDHEDGIKTNNRIGNLRLVTHSENMKNNVLQKRSKTGVLGVTLHKASGKYRAQIALPCGKVKHLGLFRSIDQAAAARLAASIKYGYHENHGRRQS